MIRHLPQGRNRRARESKFITAKYATNTLGYANQLDEASAVEWGVPGCRG
jgi:hypothetical protein